MSVYQEKEVIAPLVVTARVAASVMCVSVRHLYALTKAGKIRAVRIGRIVRYRMDDIERFLDEHSRAIPGDET
jgi:excisionase family DNA binding protein